MRFKLFDQKGLSLVEMLIGVAMSIAVGLVISSWYKDYLRALKIKNARLEAQDESDLLEKRIRSIYEKMVPSPNNILGKKDIFLSGGRCPTNYGYLSAITSFMNTPCMYATMSINAPHNSPGASYRSFRTVCLPTADGKGLRPAAPLWADDCLAGRTTTPHTLCDSGRTATNSVIAVRVFNAAYNWDNKWDNLPPLETYPRFAYQQAYKGTVLGMRLCSSWISNSAIEYRIGTAYRTTPRDPIQMYSRTFVLPVITPESAAIDVIQIK